MKKTIVFCIVLGLISSVVFAESAREMMDSASANISKISDIDVQVDLNTKDSDNAKNTEKENDSSKRIILKKPGKMKIIYSSQTAISSKSGKAKVKGATQTTAPEDVISDDNKPVSLSPACIFDMANFFENFDLTIKQKDERIKRGMEEIIAIRKGQDTQYPQIRIFMKDGQVEEMKFYSLSGKKYYEVKVNTYEKTKGIDVPVDITEKIHAQKNKVVSNIKYSNIQVNTNIPDSEFVAQP